MALSQKFPGLMVVPWYNSNEWHYVKDCIVKDDTKKAEALTILRIWKQRTSKLPSAVEGTLMLLEALVDSQKQSSKERFNCYCFALLRFLNICCGHSDKQGTFYRTAKKNNIPDWIIDLRHALAHGVTLPGEQEMHHALVSCFDWIVKEYWEKQSEILMDYVIENRKTAISVVDLYCNLTVDNFLNKNATIKDLVQADNTLREKISILKQNLFVDLSIEDGKSTLLSNLKAILDETEVQEVAMVVVKYLCCEVPDLTEINNIPHELQSLWKQLINFFFDEDLLLTLILELIKYSNSSELNSESLKLASLWLKVIFKMLNRLKKYVNVNGKEVEESECARLYKIINKIDLLESAATTNSNLFTSLYLHKLLELGGYSNVYIQSKINYVKEQFNDEEYTPSTPSTTDIGSIYFDISVGNNTTEDRGLQFPQASIRESEPMLSNTEEVILPTKKRHCVLLSDTSMFKNVPLGVLPKQRRDYNPLIEFLY